MPYKETTLFNRRGAFHRAYPVQGTFLINTLPSSIWLIDHVKSHLEIFINRQSTPSNSMRIVRSSQCFLSFPISHPPYVMTTTILSVHVIKRIRRPVAVLETIPTCTCIVAIHWVQDQDQRFLVIAMNEHVCL